MGEQTTIFYGFLLVGTGVPHTISGRQRTYQIEKESFHRKVSGSFKRNVGSAAPFLNARPETTTIMVLFSNIVTFSIKPLDLTQAGAPDGKESGEEKKYSKSSRSDVGRELHRAKKGTAKGGRGGKGGKVKSRKQAIAIGLSKARKKGKKVPKKKS